MEQQYNHSNYSSSERKLKSITRQLPYYPPPTELIEDKINQMRIKIAMKSQKDKKTTAQNQDYDKDLPRPIGRDPPSAKQRVYTENSNQYNIIPSLLTERIIKGEASSRKDSALNQTNEASKLSNYNRTYVEPYKEECVHRDKYKNPLKYKIIREQIGINNDQSVFNLKKDQIQLIKERYMKRKGLEYLREGNQAASRIDGKRAFSNGEKGRTSSFKLLQPKGRIHQIFSNPISQSKRMKSQKSLKGRKGRVLLEQLKQHQEMLGKIVFQKVKKHLKEEKNDPNYFRRVYSEETIDNALVDFLRVKIERAEASLGK